MLTAGSNSPPAASGQALALVASASATDLTEELTRLGYRVTAIDDPYAAMVELLDRPLVYRALVVSLPALYREELSIIRAVRSRLPHVDVLLDHTDGRHAALAEAMRLGATGLLSEEAIHRLADVEPAVTRFHGCAGGGPLRRLSDVKWCTRGLRPDRPGDLLHVRTEVSEHHVGPVAAEAPCDGCP